jgi:hypothetical protein
LRGASRFRDLACLDCALNRIADSPDRRILDDVGRPTDLTMHGTTEYIILRRLSFPSGADETLTAMRACQACLLQFIAHFQLPSMERNSGMCLVEFVAFIATR